MKKKAFTLIELTVALALVVLFLGLVVVRLNFGSDRQRTVAAARRLGNLIETYREKATAGDSLYALQFDSDRGVCAVYQPAERNAVLFQSLQPTKTFALTPPLTISKVMQQGRELSKPVVIFLDDKGLVPDLSIEITSGQGAVVVLRADLLVNVIRYEER